jgi:hypothetical protein
LINDHVSHLDSTVTGTSLDSAFFVFMQDTACSPSFLYLFTLFHFASSAHTKNLTVPPNRTLAISQSFLCRMMWRFVSVLKRIYSSA